MDGHKLGPLVVAAGVVVVIVGVLLWTGALSWFGRLPGDLRWEGERSRVSFPLTSMIVLYFSSFATEAWDKTHPRKAPKRGRPSVADQNGELHY